MAHLEAAIEQVDEEMYRRKQDYKAQQKSNAESGMMNDESVATHLE
jgi:hypothetical protein